MTETSELLHSLISFSFSLLHTTHNTQHTTHNTQHTTHTPRTHTHNLTSTQQKAASVNHKAQTSHHIATSHFSHKPNIVKHIVILIKMKNLFYIYVVALGEEIHIKLLRNSLLINWLPHKILFTLFYHVQPVHHIITFTQSHPHKVRVHHSPLLFRLMLLCGRVGNAL
jgi:hypothetical protein